MSSEDVIFSDPHHLSFLWANLRPRDAKVLGKAPRTLWWFGAGASHHYNLNSSGVPVPLAMGFFEAFHLLPTSQGFRTPMSGHLFHSCATTGVCLPIEVYKWTENVEDFMTSVEKEIARLRRIKAKRQLNREEMSRLYSFAPTFNNMTFILANVVNEAQNGSPNSLYRYLLDFVEPTTRSSPLTGILCR